MTTDPSTYTSGKKNFVGGNWKCNGTTESITSLCAGLAKAEVSKGVDVVISPVSAYIPLVQRLLSDTAIQIASQNVSRTGTGAYTGEIAATQLVDMQIPYTIVGHSERRAMFGDTDEVITDKITISLSNQLQVIACFGEQLADREANQVEKVCTKQLQAIVAGVVNVEDWSRVVLAYEPVWAIGTGKACDPPTAQETIKMCRDWVSDAVSPEVAAQVRIIYGGSVKPKNCEALIAQPDIDGFLVGGASLKPDAFTEIIRSAL
jgi:triosephosphate isomerase